MTRRYVYIIAAVLAGISLATFFYKWQELGFPVSGDQEQPVWTIETSIRFDAGPGSIKANLQIPTLTPGFQTLREYNVSKGYGFSVNYVSGGREAQWAVRRTGGMQTLYYRRVVYEDPANEQIDTTPPFPPPPVINEPLRTAVEVIVEDVRDRSADTASFTTELLRRCNDPSPGANIELLLADAITPAQFVETVTTVLAAARIPARMIRGVILQDQQRRVEPTPWLEVHDGDRWRYFNPNTGALISGLYIPRWDFILQSAARGLEVTGLGYLGVDIVIDRDRGPLILEMNARPGLNIQIANCTGLSTRIDRIDEIFDPEANPVSRARVCRQEFPSQRQTAPPLDAENLTRGERHPRLKGTSSYLS